MSKADSGYSEQPVPVKSAAIAQVDGTLLISKAARKRILTRIRDFGGSGGRLIFDEFGRGGTYYSDDARPALDSTDIVVRPRADCTAEEVLDAALTVREPEFGMDPR
jgi:hypothetical protein